LDRTFTLNYESRVVEVKKRKEELELTEYKKKVFLLQKWEYFKIEVGGNK
jgi:hypothetical protein